MSHTCHARDCHIAVPPTLLMCRNHWRMVPRNIQRAVWSTYRDGQCDDKRPSVSWHEAASAAIGYVALFEHKHLSRSETKSLVMFGYRDFVEQKYVEKLGEGKREAIRRALAELIPIADS